MTELSNTNRPGDLLRGGVVKVDPAAAGEGAVVAGCAVVPVVCGARSVVSKEGVVASLRRQAMLFDVPDVPLSDCLW